MSSPSMAPDALRKAWLHASNRITGDDASTNDSEYEAFYGPNVRAHTSFKSVSWYWKYHEDSVRTDQDVVLACWDPW